MARIIASSSFNNINPSAHYGYIDRATDSQYVVYDGTGTGSYGGYGLGYDGVLNVTRGTFTSYRDYNSAGTLLATVDQFAYSAQWAQYYASRNDMASFYSGVLSGNDNITGSIYADRLAGYDGNDTILSGGGNDHIDGGNGHDVIYMSSGNSYVTGGSGFDWVDLPGRGGAYSQASTAQGWQFWNNAMSMNVNLNSVERVAFDDGVKAFDTAGNAGQMYRLYQAAFARDPDAGGLGYWIQRYDNGTTDLLHASASFIGSAEFASIYGTPSSVSNTRYVELLYLNTLGRTPDQSGYDYWVGRLETGQVTRSRMLADFSESNENKAQVAGEISDGIWYV